MASAKGQPQMSRVRQQVTAIVLAAVGSGALSALVPLMQRPTAGQPWDEVLTRQAGHLLGLGSFGGLMLMGAWFVAQGGDPPRSPTGLGRLCPGCGRQAPRDRARPRTCPRCGLLRDSHVWSQDRGMTAHGFIGGLLSATLLGGLSSLFAHVGLTFQHRPRHSTGDVVVTLLMSLAFGVSSLILASFMVSKAVARQRDRRQCGLRFLANAHAAPVLAMASSAWLDEARQVQRASGVSTWEVTTPLTPLAIASLSPDRARVLRLVARLEWRKRLVLQRTRTMTWERERVTTPAVEQPGYRDVPGAKAWTCDEQHATRVSVNASQDSGHRLAQRLGWHRTENQTLALLVDRLERDRALFDAVARLGRRVSGQPDPDPLAIERRIGELATLTLG